MKLKEEKLADDETVGSFYNKVIENYDYGENYYIILIHSATMFRERLWTMKRCSTPPRKVYHHILCCICPVKLSEPVFLLQ